jgi:proline iminopeptidase
MLAVTAGGVAALLGFIAAAVVTASLPLLCVAGLLSCACVAFALGAVAGRLLGRRHWRAVAFGTGVTTVVVVVAVSLATVFRPLVAAADIRPLVRPPDVSFWELATGSRIAYRKVAARPVPVAPPVIYLHGGPGAGVVALEEVVEHLSFVTESERDLYVYDQIGGGLSGRLNDVSEYTRDRHLADLEQIRLTIEATTVTLIGQSWGAELAVHYLARRAEHVERVVLVSPGPLYPDQWQDSDPCDLKQRAPDEVRQGLDHILGPRLAAALLLLEVNPRAAHAFLSDEEGDAFVRRRFSPLIDGMVCDPSNLFDHDGFGFGMWGNVMTDQDIESRHERVDTELATVTTPVLILRGDCDYCIPEVAQQYVRLLPAARLVHVEEAGHILWLDQPTEFADLVLGFLGQP